MSTVRDLGYKPYTGTRLPPSKNTWVLLRHSFGQIWSSIITKLVVLLGWLPLVGFAIAYWFRVKTAEVENSAAAAMGHPELARPLPNAGEEIHFVLFVMLLALVTPASLSSAGVVSADSSQRAFQFYFAKPVTQTQYLIGRVGAMALWSFVILFGCGFIMWAIAVGLAPEETRLETAGLILPLIVECGFMSTVVGACAVGVSGFASKPATAISAWLLLFLVPHLIAFTVKEVGGFEWLYLTSIPGMLDIVGSALFKATHDVSVKWYFALPVLFGITTGALHLTKRRLGRAEVIA